jgi:ankyrin repeat protein
MATVQAGWTPLLWAAAKGHVAVLSMLLAAGAPVDTYSHVSN